MEKENWLPGMPADPDKIPQLRYQVIGGRVYSLQKWRDGSSARGEIGLDVLERLRGKPVTREGWYDALGEWIGADPNWS
jgi:hypothetical protein